MDKNFDNIILQEIKKTNPLFLDIGAGEAESINRFKKILPHSIIHSFEPIEERINIITNWLKTFPHNNNIILNHCAMGDIIEEKSFYVNDKTKASSFLKLNQKNTVDRLKKQIKINVNTVDNYVKQNNINHIDYLKIDNLTNYIMSKLVKLLLNSNNDPINIKECKKVIKYTVISNSLYDILLHFL